MDISSAILPVSNQAAIKNLPVSATKQLVEAGEGVSFSTLVNDQTKVPAASVKSDETQEKALHDLAVVITQQFVNEIMKDQISVGIGESMQADFHKSVFAKALAEQLTSADAFGIQNFVKSGVKN